MHPSKVRILSLHNTCKHSGRLPLFYHFERAGQQNFFDYNLVFLKHNSKNNAKIASRGQFLNFFLHEL